MGQNQAHALGRNKIVYAKKEGTAFSFEALAGTDAVKFLDFNMSGTQERGNREDWRATRSIMERITRRKTGSWSGQAYLLPSGAAGTAPDIDPFLAVAMGQAGAVVSSTSVTYNPSATQAMGTLSAHQYHPLTTTGQAYTKTGRGLWVNSMSINVNGTDAPLISFEGGCASVAHCGFGTVATLGTGVATITLQSGEGANFEVGGWIIADETDARRIVSIAGDVLTVDSVLTTAVNDTVRGWSAAPTTAGAPLGGITGGLTIGGDTVSVVSFDVTVANNHVAIDNEALAETTEDYIPGFRDVTGTITVRARADYLKYMLARRNFATVAINTTIGTAAGNRVKINMPTVEIEFGEDQVPRDTEVTLQLPFRALGASAGDNEIAIVLD